MLDDIKNAIEPALASAGFAVLDFGAEPDLGRRKELFVAFVSINEIICRQAGFDFDTGEKRLEYEYRVKCELLGKKGDCSDRGELLRLAHSAQQSLNEMGFEAELSDTLKINGALSRAQCTLTVSRRIISQETGGLK